MNTIVYILHVAGIMLPYIVTGLLLGLLLREVLLGHL